MKRITFLFLLLAGTVFGVRAAAPVEVISPDGKIKVTVDVQEWIGYTISADGQVLFQNNRMGLSTTAPQRHKNPQLTGHKVTQVRETLHPVFPVKFSTVENHYNQLLLNFRDNYSVVFRVYNEGVAYRFVTKNKGTMDVKHEEFSIGLPGDYLLHLQQPGGFMTSQEEPYTHVASREWKADDKMSELPILIDTKKGYKVLVAESALFDYPSMFLKGTGENRIESIFPPYPKKTEQSGDRHMRVTEDEDYIARTAGTRELPWRYFTIARNDGELIENTMTYKLAPKSVLTDVSWIKPGQVSWDWWNKKMVYGPDVNFTPGINNDTYKYYIDFAHRNGIPYIILDEGWTRNTNTPFETIPAIDLPELIQYGKERNVGLVLWITWLAVENNWTVFEHYAKMGIPGFKIDFMDRADQWMVNYYERVAVEAAKHKMFVDFHGSFKPSGLEYKYPNVLTYEGVRGMENMGSCTPDNSLWFPFLRNAVGPMDYTPGAMISMQPEYYRTADPNEASVGTRAYQLALFVVFESPFQMLGDSPTQYDKNPDCRDFLVEVPTLWDETRTLEAEAGQYAIVAKRKGDKWWIGGITNNAEPVREFEISLDFLDKDRTHRIISFEDGFNAGKQAMDYTRKTGKVGSGDKLKVRMVRNGGFAAAID